MAERITDSALSRKAKPAQEEDQRVREAYARRRLIPAARYARTDPFNLYSSHEREAVMACTWVGSKWPGRVPDDTAVFRCFSTDPDVTREASQTELQRLMAISAKPVFAVNHRWPDSMPQYTVGHSYRVAEIEARVAEIPGLYLIGNAFHGIGLPDCVRNAKQAAEAIQAAA